MYLAIVALHEAERVLTLDKHIYVGFSIFDLSKVLIYEFYYKYIQLKYDNYTNLLFTDTGSLVNEIKADDVYEDFYENENLFDFSDYPKDSNFFYSVNKK